MLRGYSFLYVLVIAVLISLLSSSLIVVTGFYNSYRYRLVAETQMSRSFASALDFCFGYFHSMTLEQAIKVDEHTVGIKKSWGAWDLLQIESELLDSVYVRNYFVGTKYPDSKRRTALKLGHSKETLKITGDTKINGDVFAPEGKVERGYIEGLNLNRQTLVNGKIYKSTDHFRTDNFLNWKSWLPNNEPLNLKIDDERLTNSFNNTTKKIVLNGSQDLNVDLVGNFIIESNSTLVIKRQSSLRDVIVVAPSVVIESGFSGELQIFATDSVIIENDVQLNYPSAIVVTGSEHSSLLIQENVRFHGFIGIHPSFSKSKRAHCYVQRGSDLYGEVIVNGITEFRGDLNGNLTTKQLVYSTNSGKYLNYLVNSYISSSSLSKYYVSLNRMEEGKKEALKLVK